MKKKMIAGVLGISLLSIPAAYAEESGTAVLYNNQAMTASQSVVENMGITALPFRDVAEAIGAEVGFDTAANRITAQRGGRKIEFGLYDQTITVTADGKPETLPLASRAIQNDRIFIDSVSFNHAFDVKAGWDAQANTIYIVDIQKYTNDLFAANPGLDQFFTVFGETPEKYKSTTEMKLQFDLEYADGTEAAQAVNVAVSLKEDAQKTQEAVKEAIVVDLEKLNLPAEAGVEGIDFSKLRNIGVEVVTDSDGVCYIKTDLVQKLAEAMPENQEVKTAAGLITNETWMQLDLSQFLQQMGLPGLMDMQSAGAAKDVMEKMLKSMSDMSVYSVESAKMIDSVFALYNTMFSEPYFKMTGSDTEGYEMSLDISREQFIAMIKDFAAALGEEDTAGLETEMPETFNIHVGATVSPDKEMKTDMTMTMQGKSEDVAINFVMTMDSTLTPDSEGQAIEVPTVFIDLMKIGEMLNL